MQASHHLLSAGCALCWCGTHSMLLIMYLVLSEQSRKALGGSVEAPPITPDCPALAVLYMAAQVLSTDEVWVLSWGPPSPSVQSAHEDARFGPACSGCSVEHSD